MPFVRYARDKRGYETLYVMHVFDDESRGRPRVLYACRTVPYARVGRAPLDESVQRRIQSAYPSLVFEWPRLLKEAAASAPRPEKSDPRTEPRKGRGRDRERKRKDPRAEPRTEPRAAAPTEPVPPPIQSAAAPPESARAQAVEITEPAERNVPVPAASAPPEPMRREAAPRTERVQAARHEGAEPMVIGPLVVDRAWPAVEALGEMRTLVLRGRYIEIANRVLSRVSDPAEQRRLWDEAARLNPEGWKTAEHAREALAGFDAAYEAVANQIRQQPAV